MAVEDVGISRPVDIDPAPQAEAVLLLAAFGAEMIEVGMDVLLHLVVELRDDRIIQFKEIKRVVPAPAIGSPHRVAIILAQSSGESLQSLVQIDWSIATKINPS